jgi:hypothetical protein
MDSLDFGGYVSYTVDGYKCHPFGSDVVRETISRAASELDLPPSLSLRPERSGFRRMFLETPAGKLFIYTAFVGLSEPKVNRLGSFLAIGVAAPFDLDCNKTDIGHTLHNLLVELKGKVSDGVRFTSTLSIEVFKRFLLDKSTILDELEMKLAPSNREFKAREESRLVLLSEEQLPLNAVFNRVCDKIPPSGDLFLFEVAAKDDVQNAHHDFRIKRWPVRDTTPNLRPAIEAVASQGRVLSNEVGTQSITLSMADLERIRNIDQRIDDSIRHEFTRLEALEEALSFWKLTAIVATCVLSACLILVVLVSYRWHSVTRDEMVGLRQQLQSSIHGIPPDQPRDRTPLSSGSPSAQTTNTGTAPESLDRADISQKLTQSMNPREIRKEFCQHYSDHTEFSQKLMELNPGAKADNGTYPGGRTIILPPSCKY